MAIDAPASNRVSKPVAPAGANRNAKLSLKLDGEAQMGQPLTLKADLSEATALQGWGLTVRFDPEQYRFVEAAAPEANLLEGGGATAPLFLVHQGETGEVTLASAIGRGEAPSGEGSLAVLIFQPKGEFEDTRFEVSQGILFDTDHLVNPAGMAEVLEVRPVPSEFALSQNFPNPFNPETTIAYDLAAGSQVRLEIYNVVGQRIQTLVSKEQSAGRYRVRWDGADAQGRQVASGVYFYRLHTEAFQAVRKLMLLK